ncbi:SHOCT domain-containing protein [Microbacterium sp. Root1433D1]|uniref:SHOCT domain-containing protein n=1 Tax=Microbacterium sp. Root1433D1 TaxID=1736463 RepID=UPI0009EC196C|nr:SHOCT domain-containing protein [Microbacterium sp. Root1433D1]
MAFIARRGRPGLLGMAARTAVVAGTATAVSGAVARNQQRRAAEQQARVQQTPVPPASMPVVTPPAAAPVAAGEDFFAQVEKLATLHQQGILTDEEFALAKQRLLNG